MSELKGKIKFISEVQSGTSKAGKEWKKLSFAITNNDGYENREQIFAFDVFGEEKVDKFIEYNKVGKDVEVAYNIRCNEYQGKYFTNLDAWMIKGVDANATEQPKTESAFEPVGDDDSGLPF